MKFKLFFFVIELDIEIFTQGDLWKMDKFSNWQRGQTSGPKFGWVWRLSLPLFIRQSGHAGSDKVACLSRVFLATIGAVAGCLMMALLCQRICGHQAWGWKYLFHFTVVFALGYAAGSSWLWSLSWDYFAYYHSDQVRRWLSRVDSRLLATAISQLGSVLWLMWY